MAWTASDLATVETAIRTAIAEGVASVSIGGQSVQAYTLKELRDMRTEIKSELGASTNAFGLRFSQMVPGPKT